MTGFTLLELLVVLTIVALVLTLALPRLGPSLQRASMEGAGSEISAALRKASISAVMQGQNVVFRGDTDGGYWIGRQHYALSKIGSGLSVSITGRVSFFPSGGSSGGLVRIQASQMEQDIMVDMVTGRAVVR